jgi:hydroxyacylglutathione hydrolase
MQSMNIKVIGVGPYSSNCSILWGESREAWVVDPGADADAIRAVLKGHDLSLGAVVLTHCHFDHISALNDLLRDGSQPVYLHRADESFAFSPMNSVPGYPRTTRPANLVLDRGDGDRIEHAGLSAGIITTPGHTPGGWCLYFEADALLIAGDTLFAGSVGRTDLPGGDWETLAESLLKLKRLPDDTRVICGHGPETTIGAEKQRNPYL